MMTSSPTGTNIVPNIVRPAKVAILGEAPGAAEVATGEPFVGPSGQLLFNILSRHGIYRQDVAILNVSQEMPPGDSIFSIPWPDVEKVKEDMDKANPNLIILLGNTPLHVALCGKEPPPKRRFVHSIANWRGSVFWSPFFNRKCLATYHPAHVLRNYEDIAYFMMDLRKVVEESKSPTIDSPTYDLTLGGSLEVLLHKLSTIRDTVAFDVEGSANNLICIGFATSPQSAFVIPFFGEDGRRLWTPEEEIHLWRGICRVLTDRNIKKVGQNIAYDISVLLHHGILVTPPVEDTMIKNRVLYPEMKAGLGTLASIYTKQPFYKDLRDTTDYHTFLRYNALDCVVTFAVNVEQEKLLTDPGQRSYYTFLLDLIWSTIYMQQRGFSIDRKRRLEALEKATTEWYRLQYLLDTFKPITVEAIRQAVCFKNSPGWSKPRKAFEDTIDEIRALAERFETLSPTEHSRLRVLSGTQLNTSSTSKSGEVATLLYDLLKVPIPSVDGAPSRSTDVGTLLSLMQRAKVTDLQRFVLRLILQIRSVRKFIELLSSATDAEDKWRFTLNLVGTETGRPTAHKAADGSGFNPLTTPKHGRLGSWFRPIIVPTRKDHLLFEVDLSGADGWTVAAHCARFGDLTMLDDYRAGIKPYAVVALMYLGKVFPTDPRDKIKAALKEVEIPEWLKFTAKRAQHGTSYGLRAKTGCVQLLKDSWKILGEPIYVEERTFEQLQNLFLARYRGIRLWHADAERQLRTHGRLRSASGACRIFFGRRTDQATLREWLAHEPQANTAYVTYLALHRLWFDPQNRTADGCLVVKPILMFYDALIGEFPIAATDFAKAKIREWFNNTVKICGFPITVSYEGHYGPSWGELTEPI